MCYGPEFIWKALDRWAYENGVTLDLSRLGKPTNNAFVESFNGQLWDECLNSHWFLSLADALAKIEPWRRDYNESRPHMALGWRQPAKNAASAGVNLGGCRPEARIVPRWKIGGRHYGMPMPVSMEDSRSELLAGSCQASKWKLTYQRLENREYVHLPSRPLRRVALRVDLPH